MDSKKLFNKKDLKRKRKEEKLKKEQELRERLFKKVDILHMLKMEEKNGSA